MKKLFMQLFLLLKFLTSYSKDDVVEKIEKKNLEVEQPAETLHLEVVDFI